MVLCDPELLNATNWENGHYTRGNGDSEKKGHLDHFDRRLKKQRGWLWDNFFVVDTDVNTKVKNVQDVDPILKPDVPDYDPFTKMEYHAASDMFIAHTSLPEETRTRITAMILTLGINYGPVRVQRRYQLAPILKAIKFGLDTWETAVVNQFPTAFEMLRRERAPPA